MSPPATSGLEILCEDGPVIAINKPCGWTTQGAEPGDPSSAVDRVRAYLKEKYAKPGNVYLGVVHRLDRPASGVLLFARNSKAAARLAEQFRRRSVLKVYRALVEGHPGPREGRLTDLLLKRPDDVRARVVPPGTPGAQHCELAYRVLAHEGPRGPALLEIELETGRRHQIRAQLAHRGWPIVGDRRYGARTWLRTRAEDEIALHAHRLTFEHPIRREPLTVHAPVPVVWHPMLRRLGIRDPL